MTGVMSAYRPTGRSAGRSQPSEMDLLEEAVKGFLSQPQAAAPVASPQPPAAVHVAPVTGQGAAAASAPAPAPQPAYPEPPEGWGGPSRDEVAAFLEDENELKKIAERYGADWADWVVRKTMGPFPHPNSIRRGISSGLWSITKDGAEQAEERRQRNVRKMLRKWDSAIKEQARRAARAADD